MNRLIHGLILGLILGTGMVQATPITYQFGGQINSVHPALASEILPGSIFFGSVTFDTSTADSAPNPRLGLYAPGPAFSVVVGGLSYSRNSGGTGSVMVENEFTPSLDRFAINAGDQIIGQHIFGYAASGIALFLDDYTGTALNSDGLPLTPPDFGNFDLAQFQMSFTDELLQQNVQIAGSLNYLRQESVTNIPEPESLALLGLALVGLRFMRRSRRFPLHKEARHARH